MMVLWFQWAAGSVVTFASVAVLSKSRSGGRYESSRDIKCYLVFSSGEYKSHTVWIFSLWCPLQPCGQLWTVAQETWARLLAANESKAGRPNARASCCRDHSDMVRVWTFSLSFLFFFRLRSAVTLAWSNMRPTDIGSNLQENHPLSCHMQ